MGTADVKTWSLQPTLRSNRSKMIAVVAGALAVAALVNRQPAKKAENRNPPLGRFLDVDGARLHYFERGHEGLLRTAA